MQKLKSKHWSYEELCNQTFSTQIWTPDFKKLWKSIYVIWSSKDSVLDETTWTEAYSSYKNISGDGFGAEILIATVEITILNAL